MDGDEVEEMRRYKELCGLLHDALAFYANPETYHAIAFLGDPPCGEFANDCSLEHTADYDRPMPGKMARETLQKVRAEYGDLSVYTTE